MNQNGIRKIKPPAEADVGWLAELRELEETLRWLGVPTEPGYHLSPPLGRMPPRRLQPPRPPCEPLRFRPSNRR